MRSTAYGQGTIGGKPAGTHWPLAGEGAPLAAKRTASLPSETLWMAMLIVMPYRSRPLTMFTGGGLDGRQLALACDKAFQRWRRHVLGGSPWYGELLQKASSGGMPCVWGGGGGWCQAREIVEWKEVWKMVP